MILDPHRRIRVAARVSRGANHVVEAEADPETEKPVGGMRMIKRGRVLRKRNINLGKLLAMDSVYVLVIGGYNLVGISQFAVAKAKTQRAHTVSQTVSYSRWPLVEKRQQGAHSRDILVLWDDQSARLPDRSFSSFDARFLLRGILDAGGSGQCD